MRFARFALAPLALAACASAACKRGPPRPAPPPLAVPVRGEPVIGFPTRDAAPLPGSAPDGGGTEAGASAFETALPVRGGKSIGHTSVVFKLPLEGGLVAAYKPRSKRGPARYKGEIAAYRLGAALGLPNVPRALPRAFSVEALGKALGADAAGRSLLADEAIPGASGEVPGALIPWIPNLTFLALEADPLRTEWKGWLGGGDVPEGKQALASQVSTLIVFDFLTGNWDRWSGGNVGFDVARGLVLFVDNDGAFYKDPPRAPLAAQRARLAAVTRFSRSFVARLRALSGDALEAAIGDETPGAPLLEPAAIAGVVARRAEALGQIDRRIAAQGDARTLAFP